MREILVKVGLAFLVVAMFHPAAADASTPVSTQATTASCDSTGHCAALQVVLQSDTRPGRHRVVAHLLCYSASGAQPCRSVRLAARLRSGDQVLQGGTARCGLPLGAPPCGAVGLSTSTGWVLDDGPAARRGLATAMVVRTGGGTLVRVDAATIVLGH